MAEQIAKFRFLGYKIKESSIKISTEDDINSKLNVNFEQTIGVNIGLHKMKLEFSTSITDENNNLSIYVKAEGYFEFDEDLSEKEQENFFQRNAPAILFPYIRAYISTLSSLSGIKPITLPTLNMSQR